MMKFEEVLAALREGKKAVRPGWKKNYPGYSFYISLLLPKNVLHLFGETEIVLWSNARDTDLPRNQMIHWDGSFYAVTWRTMPTDVLADDWEIYDEPA